MAPTLETQNTAIFKGLQKENKTNNGHSRTVQSKDLQQNSER